MECKYFDDIKKCCLNINTTFYGALCTGVRITCGAWEPREIQDDDRLTVMSLDGTPDHTIKATPDQTAKADDGKLRPTLVPMQIILDIANVREFGCRKYIDEDNWKRVDVKRYRDALCRHLIAYIRDPLAIDDESGLPALWHIACNVAFLCELEHDALRKKLYEDEF